MKYFNLLGFIVCVVVIFLPEGCEMLLLILSIIFIFNGIFLIKGKNEIIYDNIG